MGIGFTARSVVFCRRVWPIARSAIIQSVGLAGFAMFIEGIRRIYEPAALMVCGAALVGWTIMKVRRT